MNSLRPDRPLAYPEFTAFELPPGAQLEVKVIYTDTPATLAALEAAGRLARGLNVRITLAAVQVVPTSFPVNSPPVSRSFLEQRLLNLAERGVEAPLATTVRLCLCRDRRNGLREVLGLRALVLIGCTRRWWARKEKRLARMLRAGGHEVILVKSRYGGFNAGPLLSPDWDAFLHSWLGLRQGQ